MLLAQNCFLRVNTQSLFNISSPYTWQQVSRTFLSILADLNSAVVKMVSILLISGFLSLFSNS